MMSADDEPQLNSTSKLFASTSLTSDVFNLNPVGILPPSSSHFKPIETNSTQANTGLNLANNQALKPPVNLALKPPPQIHAPIPTKPIQAPPTPPISQTPPIQNQTAALISSLPPPLSVPAIPPPPSGPLPTAVGSNPYSARGALNKKVYDTGVNVVPINQTNQLLKPTLSNPIPVFPPNVQVQETPVQHEMPSQTVSPEFVTPVVQPVINDRTANFEPQSVQSVQSNNLNQQQDKSKKWNWFSNVVEKVVTTIDPQMKDYIHPANKPIYLVSTISNPKICHTIREAFNDAGFSKITFNACNAQNSSQFAPQIVGYACALQSAREKLDNGLILMRDVSCVLLSFQDFIAELSTDCWYELAVIMLRDNSNNVELTIFTEATPVSIEEVAQLEQLTPQDYQLRWSGLGCRLAEKNFNFNTGSKFIYLNQDTPETILSNTRLSHALKTLALLYKNKLLSIMK